MQALLNDIELDIQELKCLIEAISTKSDAALRNVAQRNICQMRSRLDTLLQLLEAEETANREVAEVDPPAVTAPILAERIKPASDLRRSISLNDSFRFSRELFGGNVELMNRVLQQMGEMASLDAALLLLLSKIQVDEENEAMSDFMELLKKYFN